MIFCKLSIFLIIAGLVIYVTGNPTISREDCRKRLTDCSAKTGGNIVPVCGSDGVTYPSECQIISKQCQGEDISVKQSGPCPEKPPCFSAKTAVRHGSHPACREDGTYEPVQCHVETGYCWCVTPQGRPLPDTSVKNNKPNCDSLSLSSSSLSASLSSSSLSSPSPLPPASYGNKIKKKGYSLKKGNTTDDEKTRRSTKRGHECSRSEKSEFNKNIIDLFKIEYRRLNSSDGDQNNERVLSWKFSTLDKDDDEQLDSDEYRELKRLAKKNVKPKKCGKTFLKTCDTDQDTYLSKTEWTACLRSDFTLLKETPVVKERPGLIDVIPDQNENDANDCVSDRKAVLDDQHHDDLNDKENKHVFKPVCTSDGRYEKIQCYAGYCWCVNQDNGKAITGSTTRDGVTPDCNPAPTPTPTPSRTMKGCSDSMRQIFLRYLIDSNEKKMKQSNIHSDELNDELTREERVATWQFLMLDVNKNELLDKKEWKSFRTSVVGDPKLRRCGKKLPKYCDVNNDKAITKTEWLSCLNVHQPPLVDSEEKTSSKKGTKNPIESILKDN